MTDTATRAEVCCVAVAEVFRGTGEILGNPIGTIPMIGGRLARETFEPDMVMTDGEATLVANPMPVGVDDPPKLIESWMPYRFIFDTLWSGRRHVMMGASQIDRHGNQNIACIGDWKRPKAQLLGVRGAPGNTVNHRTSYWVPNHSPRSFVDLVDFVSGVGYDRAGGLRFHDIYRVVSNLGVFDFEAPDHTMRLRTIHPGVSVEEIKEATGFDLAVAEDLEETRPPTDEDLRLIREVIDPNGLRDSEVRG